jgi:hypothetical protein
MVVVGGGGVMASSPEGPGEEAGHLVPQHVVGGAEAVVGGRVAALGDPGGAESVDVGFEHRVVVVDEQVTPAVVGVSHRPHQERRHLAPGHEVVGTEAVVGRRVAPPGDPGGGELLDVGLEHRAVVVGEGVVESLGEAQGSHQERGHLAAGDSIGRTVSVVRGRVTAPGDPFGGDGLDVASWMLPSSSRKVPPGGVPLRPGRRGPAPMP